MITSLRRRVRIILTTCGILALSSMALPAPAFADSSLTWYKFYPDRYAEASFKSYGEVFTVKDHEPDGMSVRVHWTFRGSSIVQGSCTNSTGDGTTKTCDYEIAEGRDIRWCLERWDRDKNHVYTFECKYDTA